MLDIIFDGPILKAVNVPPLGNGYRPILMPIQRPIVIFTLVKIDCTNGQRTTP